MDFVFLRHDLKRCRVTTSITHSSDTIMPTLLRSSVLSSSTNGWEETDLYAIDENLYPQHQTQ